MRVELLAVTQYLGGGGRPEELVEYAGRICWRSEPRGGPEDFITKLIRRGHESVLEHSRFIVSVTGAAERDFLYAYQAALGLGLSWRAVGGDIFSFNVRSLRDTAKWGLPSLTKALLEVVVPRHPAFFLDLIEPPPAMVFPAAEVIEPSGEAVSEGHVKLIGVTLADGLTDQELVRHGSLTFLIEGISRACSHQLVRHRMASYSQESQRYVRMDDFNPVIPPEIAGDEAAFRIYLRAMDQATKAYRLLRRRGVEKQDARFVLPNGTPTRLVASLPLWSLQNLFRLRCDRQAQWEIRQRVALPMLKLAYQVVPTVFADLCQEFLD